MRTVRHVVSTNGRMPGNPAREPASGVVGAVLSLATPQKQSGYSVAIWGWNDTRPAQQTLWNDVELWTSPQWTWAHFARWDLRWLAPVWWHGLTRAHVDVLHAHVDPNLLYIPGARVRLLHLQTPVPDPFPPIYRRLLRRADAVTCCSKFIRERFLATSGYPAEQTFVVYNGADVSAYHSADRWTQRIQWTVENDEVVVLYAGAIVPEKGVLHLVRAFTQVQATVPNAILVIVGGARLWEMPGGHATAREYEDYVRQVAHGYNVRFVGDLPRTQMPAAFMAADVVVVPSIWDEPLGTVVCEAMAAGRPVIASKVGGITETVQHGQSGLLVAPGDETVLAEAIRTLAGDANLRTQMGTFARERAAEFAWEMSAHHLDRIYQDLLAKNGK